MSCVRSAAIRYERWGLVKWAAFVLVGGDEKFTYLGVRYTQWGARRLAWREINRRWSK